MKEYNIYSALRFKVLLRAVLRFAEKCKGKNNLIIPILGKDRIENLIQKISTKKGMDDEKNSIILNFP